MIRKEDLKHYISILEIMESFYNLYYSFTSFKRYKKNIYKKIIKNEYKKILKHKNLKICKTEEEILKKAEHFYKSITCKDLEVDFNNITSLLRLDKILSLCKKKYKKQFTKNFEMTNEVWCVDCNKELKGSMVKYHITGKKHKKNKKDEKFLYLKIDKKKLIKKGKRIINKVLKEKNN